MEYSELFSDRNNVLFLAKITDKAQKYCLEKKVELSVDNIEKARQWLFKQQQEVVDA